MICERWCEVEPMHAYESATLSGWSSTCESSGGWSNSLRRWTCDARFVAQLYKIDSQQHFDTALDQTSVSCCSHVEVCERCFVVFVFVVFVLRFSVVVSSALSIVLLRRVPLTVDSAICASFRNSAASISCTRRRTLIPLPLAVGRVSSEPLDCPAEAPAPNCTEPLMTLIKRHNSVSLDLCILHEAVCPRVESQLTWMPGSG